jgi:starch phosphorylase
VELGSLSPDDVAVELIHGPVGPGDEIQDTQAVRMDLQGEAQGGRYSYEGTFVCELAGRYGFAVRVIPSHPNLTSFAEMGLIAWA